MLRLGPARSWRGRGGGAGQAPDVRHQPPGEKVNEYYNIVLTLLAQWLRLPDAIHEVLGFSSLRQLFAFLEHVQRHINLYI
jgi:hypothetical protein